jgi:hypothetical protein
MEEIQVDNGESGVESYILPDRPSYQESTNFNWISSLSEKNLAERNCKYDLFIVNAVNVIIHSINSRRFETELKLATKDYAKYKFTFDEPIIIERGFPEYVLDYINKNVKTLLNKLNSIDPDTTFSLIVDSNRELCINCDWSEKIIVEEDTNFYLQLGHEEIPIKQERFHKDPDVHEGDLFTMFYNKKHDSYQREVILLQLLKKGANIRFNTMLGLIILAFFLFTVSIITIILVKEKYL